jgi:parvulin-like peptidyl-prolyl isomerase
MMTLSVSTRLLVIAGVCICCLSCSRPPKRAEELARVNDRSLTKEMIDAHADVPQQLTDAQVKMYANRWVISEILYEEAKRQKLDQSESVKRNLEDAERQLAIAALLEKEIIAVPPDAVPAAQVQDYFEKHADEFAVREQTVWIGTAIFRDRRSAEHFRDAALGPAGWTAAVAEAKASKKIVDAADSVLQTQATLYPNELWRLAAAMKTNDVSFPVKTSAGFFVIHMLGSLKRGDTAPLHFVEQKIRERLSVELRQQKYSDLVEALRKKNNVQLFYADKDTLASNGE